MKIKIQLVALFNMMLGIMILMGCSNFNSGKENDTVRICAILGLTGNSGSSGQYTRDGLKLAIDEQNARGGLLNKKIVLDMQDSKTEGNTGVSIVKQMLESGDDKPLVVYTQSSKVSIPVKPIAERNKTIMIAISGAENLLKNSKYIFRNWPNPATAGKAIVNFAADSLRVKSVGIFYCNDDYGKSMQKYVSEYCKVKSIGVNFSVAFDEKEGDYKSLITQYVSKNNKLEGIYTVGLGTGLGTLIKQIRESGYTGRIFSDITTPNPNTSNAAGNAAKGLYYLDFAYSNHSAVQSQQQFYKSFYKEYNKEPLSYSVVSYEAMRLLFKAVETAKSFDSDKVIFEMNRIRDYPGVFGNSSIVNNEIIHTLDVKQIN